ncbi:MAG: phosphogluconate dehydratase [Methylomonas sp.]|nr:phosphogluconate dehydratase [Methylomonas sp.]PPD20401.1 MAG: phosphogluconate dehydratase [Methylomonas sp.]PPD25678.1 MAG: phosphogluconate dehydratase [Methylomonas sp.]PPD36655.1 MAG: phosphogluconate dehydratase [Methylomonas sp.]PPD40552.1 MAG: phosphogluconate dehydratase [Methylomonas sp.]
MHPVIEKVTRQIIERSRESRSIYLSRVDAALQTSPQRGRLPCGNLAHGFAVCSAAEKDDLSHAEKPNVGIISAYNDMLSAHEPYKDYPALIKQAVREAGGVAQFAGGVPAMCDGVTQGMPGMELSLFSRDVIALSAVIGLSHGMFDAALYLGVCDKIVPGLLIGALSFGHLPAVFVPAGPMTSGLSNKEKSRARQKYAEGKISDKELLESESKSYHGPGTCTFYGTANSNQMMVEIMGLHLPGASFVNPNTPLRDELTKAAARQVLKFTALGNDFRPIGHAIDEKAIVNAIIGLLATGGSTNHTIHLIAIAKAAGILINWDDFDHLSKAVPLLTRIYPNGPADVNQFQAAGGMSLTIAELLNHGLLHGDILTIGDQRGMAQFSQVPVLLDGKLHWQEGPQQSLDPDIIASVEQPFATGGGLHVVHGNLGRGVTKISAVAEKHQVVSAPARVFDDQLDVVAAFKRGELEQDVIVVLRFQGPKANGMPELHKLTPILGVLQDKGYKVGLVTDGRMSGASGKVPSAIHICPECMDGGPLAKVCDGDIIVLDTQTGEVNVQVDAAEFDARIAAANSATGHHVGMGRELFGAFRAHASSAETGATNLFFVD